MEHLTDATFGAALADPSPLVVDFSAAWCPPCQELAPRFAAAAARHPQVRFATVDVDASPVAADTAGVRRMPTLVAWRDGVVAHRSEGAATAAQLDDLARALTA